ncbi:MULTISPECIES: transporter substrate-binding domain-containing protein [Halomonadaceae]|uniref:transporter substrate-binding domain-containing protein n=1 Tax=Halomonadaceae TaxID=28256 RepID=UPI0015976089|nr:MULTISPECIES: transporter substrate-binding domain-containing protein [Halomonas]QJQ93959.1 transporter substrate-binding domain-containing protein [Halomonas sp. PA5]
MSHPSHQVGILISSTGPYGAVGESILNGCLLACAQVKASTEFHIKLEPSHLDPAGEIARYVEGSKRFMAAGIRHIVGCYTSISRKEVIPFLEKSNALLWYPTHYEGFETSDHVIYTGAAPNHHISPLIDYMREHYGDRAYCIGSNYIWAWESNRILREGICQGEDNIIAEKYLPIGDLVSDDVIDSIIAANPDFIFNTLIGSSSYDFFRKLRTACRRRGIDQVADYPVASCNLSESDLQSTGSDACDGHISSSVYFTSVCTPENRRFLSDYRAMFPRGPEPSVEAEAAYMATILLAKGINRVGDNDPERVQAAVRDLSFAAPQGPVKLDAENHHAWLTPRIGRSRKDFSFEILQEASSPVRPDPYLVNVHHEAVAKARKPHLRVVS